MGGLHCRNYLAEVGETEFLKICTCDSGDCKFDTWTRNLNANPVLNLGSSLQVQVQVQVLVQVQDKVQF